MKVRKVAIFTLINNEGKFILQHRTNDAPTCPSSWGFFGGTIEEGETELKALKREASEELGVELKNPLLFKRYRFEFGGEIFDEFLFFDELVYPIAELKRRLNEGQDVRIFSFKESRKLNVNNRGRTMLKELFRGRIIK